MDRVLGTHTLTGVISGATNVYNRPVILGNGDGAQLAGGNLTVTQTQQQRTKTITAGFEAVAQAVVRYLNADLAVGRRRAGAGVIGRAEF